MLSYSGLYDDSLVLSTPQFDSHNGTSVACASKNRAPRAGEIEARTDRKNLSIDPDFVNVRDVLLTLTAPLTDIYPAQLASPVERLGRKETACHFRLPIEAERFLERSKTYLQPHASG